MSLILIITLAMLALIALWSLQSYNGLVRLKAMLNEAWSGINVQLKRRYDLIPNLVATVKEYRMHEKEVLENVTTMRAVSMNAQDIASKSTAEAGLTSALKTLFAVAENYPNLKANENFLSLQSDLSKLEEEIQLARRYYNGTVRNYNIVVHSFPSRIIASIFGFTQQPFFELETTDESKAPKINF